METELQQLLAAFFAERRPEARRIFHGRGLCYPGQESLCLDWYPPLVLISCYEPQSFIDELADTILSLDSLRQVESIVWQARYQREAPAQALHGDLPERLEVAENGLRFEVHPGRRQNAGLFLDMRPLRSWLQENSTGKNVLNLFAYTCSLSVAAMAGAATGVTNVDMSKTSIAWGERNHALNGQDLRRVRSIPHNLFKSWGRIAQFGRYDLVIIDPPTRQRGSFDAEKDYGAVIKKLPKLCTPGAGVIAALNSPFLTSEFLIGKFRELLPASRYLENLSVAPEFRDKYPEKGLKICRFEFESES